jgi:hypothetical protein
MNSCFAALLAVEANGYLGWQDTLFHETKRIRKDRLEVRKFDLVIFIVESGRAPPIGS